MFWKYFANYLHKQIENSKNRRLNVEQKYNDVKQEKRFVIDFVVFLEFLKLKMNVSENSKRDKLLFDLNDVIKNIIFLDTKTSITRQKILMKIINAERSILIEFFLERFQEIRINISFKNRERQNERSAFKNDASSSINKINESDAKVTSKKRRKNVFDESKIKCYNCDKLRHKFKDCSDSQKKKTDDVNAIRKNKSKFFSRIIEVDSSDSKNWESLLSW